MKLLAYPNCSKTDPPSQGFICMPESDEGPLREGDLKFLAEVMDLMHANRAPDKETRARAMTGRAMLTSLFGHLQQEAAQGEYSQKLLETASAQMQVDTQLLLAKAFYLYMFAW